MGDGGIYLSASSGGLLPDRAQIYDIKESLLRLILFYDYYPLMSIQVGANDSAIYSPKQIKSDYRTHDGKGGRSSISSELLG